MKLPPLPSPDMTFAYTDEQFLEIQEYAIAAIKQNAIPSEIEDSPYPARMSIYSEYGTYVKFDGLGGYDSQKEHASKFLILGDVYKIEFVKIGRSSSEVKLQGIKGSFNTCLFAKAE